MFAGFRFTVKDVYVSIEFFTTQNSLDDHFLSHPSVQGSIPLGNFDDEIEGRMKIEGWMVCIHK